MNRQQAKELLPIIEAFAEGKTIESRYIEGNEPFSDSTNPTFDIHFEYRIKSEPKYRPFANKEECWQEMLKHQPFGWTKSMPNKHLSSIVEVMDGGCVFTYGPVVPFNDIYKFNTFADGTPFGIKE